VNEQHIPVVVGADGTETALRAVVWAATEARLRDRPLRIVHAAPYVTSTDKAARRRACSGPRPRVHGCASVRATRADAYRTARPATGTGACGCLQER
jgi:nucleotide-binding universal stress UspA family protein